MDFVPYTVLGTFTDSNSFPYTNSLGQEVRPRNIQITYMKEVELTLGQEQSGSRNHPDSYTRLSGVCGSQCRNSIM